MSEGRKDDGAKRRYSLIPAPVLAAVADVLTQGAAEHGDTGDTPGWRSLDGGESRYYDALMRHLEDWRSGQVKDPKTGKHPLVHVVTNAIILLDLVWSRDSKG